MHHCFSLQSTISNELVYFYGCWQFAVCLFAFFALLAVWWHIGKKQNDFGQVWLALSVLCWSISGALDIYYSKNLAISDTVLEGWRSILSLCNSLFILFALPWFRYLPEKLTAIIHSKNWKFIVGLPFLFSFFPTVSKMVSGRTYVIVNELDVYYALFTLIFLGYVLWESFVKRRLRSLAWLSLACVLITLLAQLFKLTDYSVNLTLFSAIFKTCLIMIFFALALSWVKELSESVIPVARNFHVHFHIKKDINDKIERFVFLDGLPGDSKRKVVLTPALYELFLTFAKRKKTGDENWLEIKPKSYKGAEKQFDINDYNEIKRLLTALLDGLFGKGNWTQDHHLIPLKNMLFEMSEKQKRKIRLAIPPENIIL